MKRDRYEIIVHSGTDANGTITYHGELWVNPFSGWLLASTRAVSTQRWARRDATRVFGPFLAAQEAQRKR